MFWTTRKKTGDWLSVTGIKCCGGGGCGGGGGDWPEGKKLTSENNGLGLIFGARGRGRWAKLNRTTVRPFRFFQDASHQGPSGLVNISGDEVGAWRFWGSGGS